MNKKQREDIDKLLNEFAERVTEEQFEDFQRMCQDGAHIICAVDNERILVEIDGAGYLLIKIIAEVVIQIARGANVKESEILDDISRFIALRRFTGVLAGEKHD